MNDDDDGEKRESSTLTECNPDEYKAEEKSFAHP